MCGVYRGARSLKHIQGKPDNKELSVSCQLICKIIQAGREIIDVCDKIRSPLGDNGVVLARAMYTHHSSRELPSYRPMGNCAVPRVIYHGKLLVGFS
jgi:hypothetical protein